MQRVLKTTYDSNGQPRQIPVMRDLYTYTAGFTGASVLAAGASLTDIINFESDSDFIWTKSTFVAYDAAVTSNGNKNVAITVSINDSGTGRNLQQEPTPITSMAGTGSLPFILPQARTIKGNSTVQFVFTNFSAADTYQYCYLTLHGFKEWRV